MIISKMNIQKFKSGQINHAFYCGYLSKINAVEASELGGP